MVMDANVVPHQFTASMVVAVVTWLWILHGPYAATGVRSGSAWDQCGPSRCANGGVGSGDPGGYTLSDYTTGLQGGGWSSCMIPMVVMAGLACYQFAILVVDVVTWVWTIVKTWRGSVRTMMCDAACGSNAGGADQISGGFRRCADGGVGSGDPVGYTLSDSATGRHGCWWGPSGLKLRDVAVRQLVTKMVGRSSSPTPAARALGWFRCCVGHSGGAEEAGGALGGALRLE